MITVLGPDWPSTSSLRKGLDEVPEEGTIRWGASPCDKFHAFSRLRSSGIYTPISTSDVKEARDWVRWGITVWGRRLRHTQGKDIARFNHEARWTPGGRRWSNRDFWVQVLPSLREWRCHVWEGRAFRMGVKGINDADGVFNLSPMRAMLHMAPIRSDRYGWQLCYSDAILNQAREDRKPLRDLAKAACVALGISGGAVDILESLDGSLVVLEVNTAPALGEHTLEAYIEAIRKGIRKPKVRVVQGDI